MAAGLLPNVILRRMLGLIALGAGVVAAHPLHAADIYKDTFDRVGDLNGSTPDTDASGDTWTTSLSSIYTTTGTSVVINPGSYTYTGAYLQVNDKPSDMLTGLQDFTLSATVSVGAENTSVGIALLNSPLSAYSPYNDKSLGSLSTYLTFTLPDNNYDFSDGGVGTGPGTISIVYSASAGTLTYELNGTPLTVSGTQAVTAAQIAALTDVSFGFGGNNTPQTSSATQFELFVAGGSGSPVPEPASLTMLALGGVALIGRRRRACTRI
jgi:hypothetical protein